MRAHHVLAPLALVGLLMSAAPAAEGPNWQTSVDAACKIAAQTNRLVLVHFWGSSCGPCLRLDREVFSQAEMQAGLEANFVPVKVNADYYPDTARQWGIEFLPTDVVLDARGQRIAQYRVNGGWSTQQYLAQLAEVSRAARPSQGMLAQWYVREQSISYDYHRYGNLGSRAKEVRRPLVGEDGAAGR